jgi:O-antigen/teichoic acid export membrane protein
MLIPGKNRCQHGKDCYSGFVANDREVRRSWLEAMQSGVSWMNSSRLRQTLTLAYVATALAQMAEVAFVFLLYRQFLASEIGLFSWAGAWFAFAYVVVDFGLEPLMVRRTASQPVSLQRMVQAVFALRLPLLLLGACLLAILWMLRVLDEQQALFLLLLCTQIIFNIADTSQRAWLRANGRQTTANALLSGLAILKLLVMVVCGVWLQLGLVAVLFALLLMRLPYSIVHRAIGAACPALKDVQNETVSMLIRWQLRVGAPLVAMGLLTTLQNRLDWLLVARFVSVDALAVYSLANKAYEIAQVVIGVATTTMYPILCTLSPRSAPSQMTVLKLVLLTGLLMGIGGMIALPPTIHLIFGDKYGGIDLPLQILMLAVGFMAATGVLYSLALSQGLERKMLIVAVLASALQAASNFWMIRHWGIAGASISMVVLVVAMASGLLYLCIKAGLFSARDAWRLGLTLAVYALVCSMIIFFQLAGTALGIAAAVLMMVAAPALLLMPEEWRRLMHASRPG